MRSERTRALSDAQARRGEEARHPRGPCRCGGTLHGAQRGSVLALPLEDPHAPSQRCPACGGSGLERLGGPCQACQGQRRVPTRRAIAAALALGPEP